MNARRRDRKNRGLPDNLYVNGKYFQYRNPITGKKISINRPLADAVRLARAANAKLLPLLADARLLEAITGEPASRVKNLLDRFESEYMPTRKLAESTQKEMRIRLDRYREDLGQLLLGQLDVLRLAEYLDAFENNAYTKHRGLWVHIYRFAVAKGLAEHNVAEMTLRKIEGPKVRGRHTADGVNKILEAETTPDWLAKAIRLAVLSLQRREDLVNWQLDAVDLDKNTIKISPSKTQNYSQQIHLEIEMGEDLREAVIDCVKSPVVGPNLIRYKPLRVSKATLEAKTHWSAVTPDHLTRAFTKARDDAGAYDNIRNKAGRPTFHELRAFGAWLYEQQGFSTEYVQALLGHADSKMTEYYQSGHGEEGIEYQRVSAGLSLKKGG